MENGDSQKEMLEAQLSYHVTGGGGGGGGK
jgi:hypothetical protein